MWGRGSRQAAQNDRARQCESAGPSTGEAALATDTRTRWHANVIPPVPRRARWLGPIGAGVLAALQPASMSAAENMAGPLRGFRAAPAGFVHENLQSVAMPTPVLIVRESPRGYAAWAAEVFTAAELADPRVSAPDAMGAADGLTNSEKYAIGLDPHAVARAADLPECGQLDDHCFLWYRRPSDTGDVEYRVEVSTDGGVNWSSTGVTQEPILANDLAQSWQAHYHAAAGESVLLRLVVALR